MKVTTRKYDALVERHSPIIFIDVFLEQPIWPHEGRRLVEAGKVRRLEHRANVLVLHTKG